MTDYELHPFEWDVPYTLLTENPNDPPRTLLWNNPGEKFCKVHSNAINLILGRNVHEITRMAMRCAFDLAVESRSARLWEGFTRNGKRCHWGPEIELPPEAKNLDSYELGKWWNKRKLEEPEVQQRNDALGRGTHRILYVNTYQRRGSLRECFETE